MPAIRATTAKGRFQKEITALEKGFAFNNSSGWQQAPPLNFLIHSSSQCSDKETASFSQIFLLTQRKICIVSRLLILKCRMIHD